MGAKSSKLLKRGLYRRLYRGLVWGILRGISRSLDISINGGVHFLFQYPLEAVYKASRAVLDPMWPHALQLDVVGWGIYDLGFRVLGASECLYDTASGGRNLGV